MKIEYRVRPVTRYIVTRYEMPDDERVQAPFNTQHGEYQNAETAYEVGYALAKAEHDRLGWAPGDERMIYPKDPRHPTFNEPEFVKYDGHAELRIAPD